MSKPFLAGSLIVGVKMTGNQFVPAGETTFQVILSNPNVDKYKERRKFKPSSDHKPIGKCDQT